jgi:hypothetical protein
MKRHMAIVVLATSMAGLAARGSPGPAATRQGMTDPNAVTD